MENAMAQIGNARVLARRDFVGGSDARIIMSNDEEALLRLWREKRGEAGPEDLSRNLIVQLGIATEQLNREWFQTATGQQVTDIQKHTRHPGLHWMGPRWMAASKPAVRSSKANLCCRGLFLRRRPPRNIRLSCNTTCLW